MAKKGLLKSSAPGHLAMQGKSVTTAPTRGSNDIWQGYGTRWTNSGLEITARTSREFYGPIWVGAAVGLVVAGCLFAYLPDIDPTLPRYHPAIWFGLAFIAFIVMGAIASPFYYLLPRGALRSRKTETLEIRPDGITVNGRKFFPRSWIHRIGMERLKDDVSDHPWAVVGVIGTKKMNLLAGFDDPTAEVVGQAIEQAKRQLWQQVQ